MHKLIEAIEFPSVVAPVHIDRVRDENSPHFSPQLRADFVRAYLGVDDNARFALDIFIGSLVNNDAAGAFFINGVFGAGKSHLLGILTLLGEGAGHDDFLALHPHFTPHLANLPRRFVVYFSLDNYDGAKLSLEEITQREIVAQARKIGMKISAFASDVPASRSEKFAALEDELRAHGYVGLQLCVDELSLFLGAKNHRSLQRAASWLQFLGQRCAAQYGESTFTYRCFFSLQKDWENVGDLEPYSLTQVRDRYKTITLSMAHLPALVQQRLVRRLDVAAIRKMSREIYARLLKERPALDFGADEWESLYPFHPVTIRLLRDIAARFFSRTRSAMLFCAEALRKYFHRGEETARIGAAAVFNYFQPEFAQFAELRPLERIWSAWEMAIPQIASVEEIHIYADILKIALLFRLSGRSFSAVDIANALPQDLGLLGDDNYRYIYQLLTKWSETNDYLACEKSEDWRDDRFSVDFGQSIKHAVRQQTQRSRETLQRDDPRIVARLLEMCSTAVFPLRKLLAGEAQLSVDWHNSPRQVQVALWRHIAPEYVINQLAANAQGAAKVLLYVALPLSDVALPDLTRLDTRARAALLVWRPRALTSDEWEFANETTARLLLRDDPILKDNRRGQSMLQFLETDLKQRTKDARNLMLRLYAEGNLVSGDQRCVDVAELCHHRKWEEMIAQIAAFALEEIYPNYPKIAPAVKVLSSMQTQQMEAELLRQSRENRWWSASLDRPVRAIATPLGLTRDDKGRRKFAAGNEELRQEIEKLLEDEVMPVRHIIEYLAASSWGLMPLQSELLLCGMIGAGLVEAMSAQAKVLLPPAIKLPLEENIYALRRTLLLNEKQWVTICAIWKILGGTLESLNFATQMYSAQQFREWMTETRAEIELANARLRQLQKALGDAPYLWKETAQTLSAKENIIDEIGGVDNTSILEIISGWDVADFQHRWNKWRELHAILEAKQRQILQISRRLQNPHSIATKQLTAERNALLKRFVEGEKVLFDTSILENANRWSSDFADAYREWHQKQYHDERWDALRELAADPALTALAKLRAVSRYPFPEDTFLWAKITEALRHRCPRDGALLPDEAVCNHCQLAYGEKVLLPDIDQTTQAVQNAVKRFANLRQNVDINSYLTRTEAGRKLLKWDGSSQTFPALLSESTFSVLEKALMPRRQFTRSTEKLKQRILGDNTRSELEKIFCNWLEEDVAVGADDEIIVIE